VTNCSILFFGCIAALIAGIIVVIMFAFLAFYVTTGVSPERLLR
jgi:hypothetical protein